MRGERLWGKDEFVKNVHDRKRHKEELETPIK